jgi:hypothetical protein
MSLSSKYDAGSDRCAHYIARLNLHWWMALMNVYRGEYLVNSFFRNFPVAVHRPSMPGCITGKLFLIK